MGSISRSTPSETQPIVNHLEFLNKKESTIDEEAEDQLYDLLKDLPDFLNYPLPARWFKKYNIPPIEPTNVKDYIHSNHAFKMMFAPKDLPAIIINEPQRDLSGNIKLVKMVEEAPIEVEVVSKPYDSNPSDQSLRNDVVHLVPNQQEPEQQH
jgi:hypothetical protein